MKPGRSLGLEAGVLAAVIAASIASGQVGAAEPTATTTEENRREEIGRLLTESAAFQGKGDLTNALNRAGRAYSIARTLPPTGPEHRTVALRLLGLRCEFYVAKNDYRAAVKTAAEASKIAQGSGPGDDALRWARYAAEVATRFLPAGDPDRVRAELMPAILECQTSQAKGDTSAALGKVKVASIIASALPAEDPDRVLGGTPRSSAPVRAGGPRGRPRKGANAGRARARPRPAESTAGRPGPGPPAGSPGSHSVASE